MNRAASPLLLRFGGGGSEVARYAIRRREPRVRTVDLVEYSPFPRVRATQGRRVGFTRDRSASGMCLEVGSAFEVGSLLQITVRSIDGRQTLRTLARVVWCSGDEGQAHVGLTLLGPLEQTREPPPPAGDLDLPHDA